MNFEQIISSLEKLIYRIIIEIILLVVTIKKVLSNTKNSFKIVAEEESNPEENRYQHMSSPVKFAIVIALTSVFAVQQMIKLDEKAAQSHQHEVLITEPNASDTTQLIASGDSAESTAGSDSAVDMDNELVTSDMPVEDEDTDDSNNNVHSSTGRLTMLSNDILKAIEKLDIVEQSVFFFFYSNLDAILIALLLGRILKQNFPGPVFRSSMFSMIYAKCYITLPLLLMLIIMIFIPEATTGNENEPITMLDIIAFFSILLFIIGHYFFLKASYYILQQFIAEKKRWFKFSILVFALILDYSWILLLV